MAISKERPMPFNAHMVRSILDGSKTVTRVAVNKRTLRLIEGAVVCGESFGLPENGPVHPNDEQYLADFCTVGLPGDRLWVREDTEADFQTSDSVVLSRYTADKEPVLYSGCADPEYNGTVAHWDYQKHSRPRTRMQRWASRILLEITSVRIERLQDIDDEQCIAEGIRPVPKNDPAREDEHQFWHSYHLSGDGTFCCRTPRQSFQTLWLNIRGKSFDRVPDTSPDAWDANPWVWVVEFRRVESDIAQMPQVVAA